MTDPRPGCRNSGTTTAAPVQKGQSAPRHFLWTDPVLRIRNGIGSGTDSGITAGLGTGLGATFALIGLATPAAADCSVNGTETLCTGTVDHFISEDFTAGSASGFVFRDLDDPIPGTFSRTVGGLEFPAIGLVSDVAGSDITLNLDGSIATEGHAIGIVNAAPDGSDGKDGNKADPGEAGANSGTVSVTIDSGSVEASFDPLWHEDTSAVWSAIYAHSAAGDGGDGGEGTNKPFNASVGGDGGVGGDGDDVTVELSAGSSVEVSVGLGNTDQTAVGILAESFGGDGGDGGDASVIFGGATGGAGGAGGKGGDVTVLSYGSVSSFGAGIVARSLGGAGGDGGSAGGVNASGGGGAQAGDGGTVSLSLLDGASVSTRGTEAVGLLAQSIGGFAGNGGAGSGLVTFGGDSESGGDGGTVSLVMRDSTVTTAASASPGVIAQSIGGGGGLAGSGAGLSALGGTGNAGGDGGLVDVQLSNATITTAIQNSNALSLLSIGGGGGMGGSSSGIVSIGGDGGAGGDGGDILLSASGALSTAGSASDGIMVASIGGGGGTAFSAKGALSWGGDGDTGGDGGDITVANSAQVTTTGRFAEAIVLQSVGGGGGNGASSAAAGLALALSYGGDGGAGGNGGDVTYTDLAGTAAGAITTTGNMASALVVQSLGGGGGIGGDAKALSAGTRVSVSLGASGDGGSGGSAGDVSVTTAADISTEGDLSGGIKAMSQGGGGGDSGEIFTASVAVTGANFALDMGGSAGVAGDGGSVSVETSGSITTAGEAADAILAQSLGGGGGTARSSSSLSVGYKDYSFSGSLGSKGGAGGSADTVTVVQGGAILTRGDASRGIFAQSVGGGGGDGSSALNPSFFNGGSVGFSLGLAGGAGGDGSMVSVTSSAAITTEGESAAAILAQSVGGGGGTGGMAGHVTLDLNTANFSLGGKGGEGGTGGDVTVTVEDAILTEGNLSYGVMAQSLGGGGGLGGMALGLSVGQVALNLSLGGSGGVGGDGGDSMISLGSTGSVTTLGAGALGLTAQSVGAGGGIGAYSLDIAVARGMTMKIGAADGAAGAGGAATIDTAAGSLVDTSGEDAVAIVAQSIGGGGGLSIVNQELDLDDATDDEKLLSIGGDGQSSSDGAVNGGGTVTVGTAGSITTSGARSYGILAQSIGGGGGATLGTLRDADMQIRVGGINGASGDGGAVAVSNAGTIVTTGDQGAGIVAQSIGGGGGLGPDAMLAFGMTAEALNMGSAVGGEENGFLSGPHYATGASGTVSVQSGDISTSGAAAHGVVAQSIAGGGGIAVVTDADGTVLTAMAGSTGLVNALGTSGEVSVVADGTVAVSGTDAHGIIAQSVAPATQSAGDVSVEVTGAVSATGADGRGILAQSVSDLYSGTITLDLAEGASVLSGASSRAAVLLLDGSDNVITNAGSIIKEGAFEDASDENYAIQTLGDGVATQVINTGLISGSLWGDGLLVENLSGGIIEFGSASSLGGGLSGSGTITAGEQGVIRASGIAGAVALDGATILVDHQLGNGSDIAAGADLLSFSGAVTSLSGMVETEITGTNLVAAGETGSVAFLKLPETYAGNVSLGVENTGAIRYTLLSTTSDDVVTYSLGYDVDYTPWQQDVAIETTAEITAANASTTAGLTLVASGTASAAAIPDDVNLGNMTRFGDYLSALVAARQAELASGSGADYAWTEALVSQVLAAPDVAALIDDYEMLVPALYSAPLDANMLSSINFADALLSCSGGQGGATFSLSPDGNAPFGSDGNACLWGSVQGSIMTRDATGSTQGYEEQTLGLSGGLQTEVAAGLFAGFGLSFEASDFTANGYDTGWGERLQMGLLLERHAGPWRLGLGLTGGLGRYEMDRLIDTPDGMQTAHGNSTIGFLSLHGRASRRYDLGNWYMEPGIDAGVHGQWRPGFSETGAGDYGARFSDYSETAFTVNPQVTLGGAVGPDTRIFLNAGVLGVISSGRDMLATFTGVGDDGPMLLVSDQPDDLFAKLSIGIDSTLSQAWTVRLEAKTLLGRNQRALSGLARLEYRF